MKALSQLAGVLILILAGLGTLAVAGPALGRLISALIPLVLVVSISLAILRVIWVYTRRW
jgi:hypothetical protein